MSRLSAQSGFTLVEALVALAIAALSLTVLFRTFSDNLERTRRARDETLAAALAQSLLAQAQDGAPAMGEAPGGLRWRVAVSPYADEKSDNNSKVSAVRVAATVSWRDGKQERSRTLTTVRVIAKAAP